MLRRDFGSLALSALALSCSKKRPADNRSSTASEARASGATSPSDDWQTLSFDASSDAPDGEEALLFAPKDAKEWPLLVALHGRGEAGRGLRIGSHGWRDDYDVEAMHTRLGAPPIVAGDVGDMIEDTRLAAINASLQSHRYSGISLACPYTPIVTDPSVEGAQPFARFVVDALLPKAAAATSRKNVKAATGIDGVSMGGRLALLVGLQRPEAFASIGAMQPAIRVEEAALLSTLTKRAMAKSPFAFRLMSSSEDPFLEAVRAFSAQLDVDQVPHELSITRGPHDYVWNRGPGACEMLLFHERALRGLPPI